MTVIERERMTEVMPQILDPRVERGAALLDEKMPGWADKINLGKLKLPSDDRCVLGQIGLCTWGETYEATARKILPGSAAFSQDACDHGFIGNNSDGDGWRLLEQDWRLAILARKEGA